LVLPNLVMPTADVYRRFDAMGLGRESDVVKEPDWTSWARMRSEDLLPRLVNDLEPPAFNLAPQLGALRARVEEMTGRAVRMSGSGSSLFTLFDDERPAEDAAAHIERETRERALAVEVCPILRDDLNEEFEDR
jgi:4-diphosphocytidyl-2-C-methyl-D-erythritol kinase